MPPVLTGWKIDKHFPIAVVIAIVGNTVWMTYWVTSKYDEVENRVTALERSDDGQQSHETRIVKLEQQFDFIRSDLAEIKTLLRRQIPGGNP